MRSEAGEALHSMDEAGVKRQSAWQGIPPIVLRCLLLMVVAVAVCVATEAVCRYVLHLGDPVYRWPLRRENVRFPDLVNFYPRFKYLHTEAFFTWTGATPFMYPATATIPYECFYAFAPHIVAAYLSFAFGSLTVAAALFTRALFRRGVRLSAAAALVLLGLLCCYPVWFALGQANLEIVVWALIAGGIAFFLTGKGYGAAVCFGLTASLKIYPVLFLVLLLVRRQYRQAIAGVVAAAVFSAGALIFVGPTFAAASKGIQHGLDLFRQLYMLTVRNETGVDHSLFALFKRIFWRHAIDLHWASGTLTLYLGLMALLTLGLLVGRVWRQPVLNQIVFCTVVCVLFPPTSFEYTLLHVLTVFGALILLAVDTYRTGQRIPGLTAMLLCCAATLVFLPEVIHHGKQWDGQLKCLLLVALLVLTLRYPLQARPTAEPSGMVTRG